MEPKNENDVYRVKNIRKTWIKQLESEKNEDNDS